MPYCAIADVREIITDEELIQLTDDARIGAINETRVNQAVASADAEIDGYCAARYTVPFTTIPALVKKCSVDIAVYNLHARRALTIPEARQVRYDNAVRILKDIAAGTVTIEDTVATQERDVASSESGDRLFTRENMKNF